MLRGGVCVGMLVVVAVVRVVRVLCLAVVAVVGRAAWLSEVGCRVDVVFRSFVRRSDGGWYSVLPLLRTSVGGELGVVVVVVVVVGCSLLSPSLCASGVLSCRG